VLLSISLGLIVSVIYLFIQIHFYFDIRVMMAEAGRIRTILLVFTLTYVSRAVVHLLGMYDVIGGYDIFLIYHVLYSVWDVIPLTLIMIYHSQCYGAQQRQLEEEA